MPVAWGIICRYINVCINKAAEVRIVLIYNSALENTNSQRLPTAAFYTVYIACDPPSSLSSLAAVAK